MREKSVSDWERRALISVFVAHGILLIATFAIATKFIARESKESRISPIGSITKHNTVTKRGVLVHHDCFWNLHPRDIAGIPIVAEDSFSMFMLFSQLVCMEYLQLSANYYGLLVKLMPRNRRW